MRKTGGVETDISAIIPPRSNSPLVIPLSESAQILSRYRDVYLSSLSYFHLFSGTVLTYFISTDRTVHRRTVHMHDSRQSPITVQTAVTAESHPMTCAPWLACEVFATFPAIVAITVTGMFVASNWYDLIHGQSAMAI